GLHALQSPARTRARRSTPRRSPVQSARHESVRALQGAAAGETISLRRTGSRDGSVAGLQSPPRFQRSGRIAAPAEGAGPDRQPAGSGGETRTRFAPMTATPP